MSSLHNVGSKQSSGSNGSSSSSDISPDEKRLKTISQWATDFFGDLKQAGNSWFFSRKPLPQPPAAAAPSEIGARIFESFEKNPELPVENFMGKMTGFNSVEGTLDQKRVTDGCKTDIHRLQIVVGAGNVGSSLTELKGNSNDDKLTFLKTAIDANMPKNTPYEKLQVLNCIQQTTLLFLKDEVAKRLISGGFEDVYTGDPYTQIENATPANKADKDGYISTQFLQDRILIYGHMYLSLWTLDRNAGVKKTLGYLRASIHIVIPKKAFEKATCSIVVDDAAYNIKDILLTNPKGPWMGVGGRLWRHTIGRVSNLVRAPLHLLAALFMECKVIGKIAALPITYGSVKIYSKITRDKNPYNGCMSLRAIALDTLALGSELDRMRTCFTNVVIAPSRQTRVKGPRKGTFKVVNTRMKEDLKRTLHNVTGAYLKKDNPLVKIRKIYQGIAPQMVKDSSLLAGLVTKIVDKFKEKVAEDSPAGR